MRPRTIAPPRDLVPDDVKTLTTALGKDGGRDQARELLSRRPELLQAIGTQAAETERYVIEAACGGSVLLEEAARVELAQFKAANLRPGDDALCRLLVARLAIAWLALQTAEQRRATTLAGSFNFSAADFWDRHVGRLHGDFLRAARVLASVRRLLGPAVQVNVGQVNVGR